jgi:hypothetical protein
VTLTLPDDVYYPVVSEFAVRAKRWLDAFFKRLSRACPTAAGFWRIEWQDRKSGEHVGKLFPHFHLLLWGLPERDNGGMEAFVDLPDPQLSFQFRDLLSEFGKQQGDWKLKTTTDSGLVFAGSRSFVARCLNVRDACLLHEMGLAEEMGDRARKMSFQDWASMAWYHVVDSHNLAHLTAGVRVERIRSWRGAMWYCGKYMAKPEGVPGLDGALGRMWGIFNRAGIPWGKMIDIELPEEVGVRLRRIARRYLARCRTRDVWAPYGITLYCDVDRWRRLWQLAQPDPF